MLQVGAYPNENAKDSRHSMRQIIIMWLCLCVTADGSGGFWGRMFGWVCHCITVYASLVEMFFVVYSTVQQWIYIILPPHEKVSTKTTYPVLFRLSFNNFPCIESNKPSFDGFTVSEWFSRDTLTTLSMLFCIFRALLSIGDNMDATRMVKSSSIRPGVV